jgi:hypothetical protein
MGAGTSVISTHGLTTLRDTVKSSQTALSTYSSDNDAKSLITAYYNLEQDISKTIRDISGASANTIAAEQSGYTAEMLVLDDERDRIITKLKGYTVNDTLRQISYGVCMLFAVIIITNMMVSENIYYKLLFYTPWGMIFYPFVLLYCLYDPPVWRALLIPLFELSTSTPAWARRLLLFTYSPPGAVNLGGDGKQVLRLLTAGAVGFFITMQVLN